MSRRAFVTFLGGVYFSLKLHCFIVVYRPRSMVVSLRLDRCLWVAFVTVIIVYTTPRLAFLSKSRANFSNSPKVLGLSGIDDLSHMEQQRTFLDSTLFGSTQRSSAFLLFFSIENRRAVFPFAQVRYYH